MSQNCILIIIIWYYAYVMFLDIDIRSRSRVMTLGPEPHDRLSPDDSVAKGQHLGKMLLWGGNLWRPLGSAMNRHEKTGFLRTKPHPCQGNFLESMPDYVLYP